MLCTGCNQDKLEDCFSKKKSSNSGYQSRCKECQNNYLSKTWYPKNKDKHILNTRDWKSNNKDREVSYSLNISIIEAKKLIEKGKTSCDICGSNKNLNYDHCHKTNLARGVLCTKCNMLLGKLGDNLESVKDYTNKILEYLKSNLSNN
jgi:hypothetical protein